MAYSGRYTVENKKKYKGDYNNVIYRSLWERDTFKWCDQNPKVKEWSSEEIIVPYFYDVDKKYHRYFPDLKIVFENKTILVEIKPHKETAPPTGARKTKKYIAEGLTYVRIETNGKLQIDFVKIVNGSFRFGLKKHCKKWV